MPGLDDSNPATPRAERRPIKGWSEPDATERLKILRETRHVAVVGVSSDPARASHEVAAYLRSYPEHFSVSLVNPRESKILGRPVFPTLSDLDSPPDLVDVFRRPEYLPAIAEEAVAVGASTLWLQLGLYSPEAAEIALRGGLRVVMDRCLKVDHALVCDAL